MFITLQKDRNFGCINIGKKLKMKVKGMVRVLKLHNGKVQDIPNMWYLSIANVNIVSLGQMVSHVYKYLRTGKACKVYKGSLNEILEDSKVMMEKTDKQV